MKSLPLYCKAENPYRLTPTISHRAIELKPSVVSQRISQQRGVVLFFTLIALLAMSLAAVALIRSVDTSAMISGNLAFKQSATASAELGIDNALGKLWAIQMANVSIDIDNDSTHPLNQTNLAANPGYYASLDPTINVTDPSTWSGPNSAVTLGNDLSGNRVSYIVQRMCRTSGVRKLDADCLLASPPSATSGMEVQDAPSYCPNCGTNGQPAQTRVTVRSEGANHSVSFVQGIIF
ncbi:MAG: hypothetical protein HZB47_07655 [Nitrosomonadales bacterium]|nr:hypothetical protein [Nitrosomonadales bacterium]